MAMADAFARLGRPAPSAEAVRRIVGLSLPAAMAALAPDGDAALTSRPGLPGGAPRGGRGGGAQGHPIPRRARDPRRSRRP